METKQSKFKRWTEAIKNMSPERMLTNKFIAEIGTCVGMLAGMVTLVIVKQYWFLWFMPFVWFIQLLSLLGTWQQRRQIKQVKAMIEKSMKGDASPAE